MEFGHVGNPRHIYREFCKARLTECARWLAIEHADGESKRRIFHGHTNGTRDLGDDWSPAIAHVLAYSNCAGLTGLGSSIRGISPSALLGACSLRNLRQIDIDVL